MRSVLCALAVLSLAGCVTAPVRGPFPFELTEPCLVGSKLGVATAAELSDSVAKLAHTLKLCNIDKQKLKEYGHAEAAKP